MSELALDFSFGQQKVRTISVLDEIWFVLKDVCDILGIQNSRRVYAEMLDDDEKGVRKTYTPGGEQEVQTVNEPGLYTVILRSNSEQAKPFRRWVTHDVLPSIRKQGYYSLLSDDQLIELITERQKRNPGTLALIDKTKIKREALQEVRDAKVEETRQVWFKRFTYHEEVDVPKELRRIWAGDMPMYHKYLDQFHADENRERKGQLVTI